MGGQLTLFIQRNFNWKKWSKKKKHAESFKADDDNETTPFLSLCLTFEYLTLLEYSWAFMHLVILATEHQLQIPILLAYPLVADELF